MTPGSIKALPTVAVCLAAFNGTNWLCEQLDSILEQSGVAVKIFVSVDRSSDGTEAWFERRASRDDRIVVLPYGEHFGGAARNFFRLLRDVDFNQFDYLSFADQDDIWLPNKLLRAHEVLFQTGADAYSSNVIAFWPSGRRVLVRKSQPQKRWDFLFEAAGPGCTYVMRPELARAIQTLLRENWSKAQEIALHDWFSYAFARANGYRWIIDEYAGMLYRQHEGNQIGVNAGRRALLSRLRMIFNGWWLTQAALISEIAGLSNTRFVRRYLSGGRWGALGLVLHAKQCRRRVRDQVLFAFVCITLFVTGRCG